MVVYKEDTGMELVYWDGLYWELLDCDGVYSGSGLSDCRIEEREWNPLLVEISLSRDEITNPFFLHFKLLN